MTYQIPKGILNIQIEFGDYFKKDQIYINNELFYHASEVHRLQCLLKKELNENHEFGLEDTAIQILIEKGE